MNRMTVLICTALLLAPAHAGPDPGLGVLLTTPQEREDLEKLRGREQVAAIDESSHIPAPFPAGEEEAAPAALPGAVRLRGVVRRSGGAEVAWINESHTLFSRQTPDGVRLDTLTPDGAGAVLELVASGERIVLRSGQTRDLSRHQTYEVYVLPGPPPQESAASRETADSSPTPHRNIAQALGPTGEILEEVDQMTHMGEMFSGRR